MEGVQEGKKVFPTFAENIIKRTRGLGNDFSILQLAERLISLAAKHLQIAATEQSPADEPSLIVSALYL